MSTAYSTVLSITNTIFQVAARAQTIVASLGVLVNIFHLFVLFQKSMRYNSINVIMIGIALCDLYNMVYLVSENIKNFAQTVEECPSPPSLVTLYLGLCATGLQDVLRRLCGWLGVLMGTIRCLAIKNALNTKYDYLSQPKLAIRISIVACLLSTLLTLLYWIHVSFIQMDFSECALLPIYKLSMVDFFWMSSTTALQIFNVTDGALKIITITLLPILTMLLIQELRRAKLSREKFASRDTSSTKTDQTTRMVILMTIAFIVTEGPLGIIYIIQGVVTEPSELLTILGNILYVCSVFVALNSTTHCVICLTVSSQYQKTVKDVFKCRRKREIRKISISPLQS